MKIIIIISFILNLILCSCKDKQTTNPDNNPDKNRVEITDTASVFVDCLDATKISYQGLIFFPILIRDSIDYLNLDSLLWDPKFYPKCENYLFPDIDFSKNTLFGYYMITGTGKKIRHVYKDTIEKKYIYNVEIIQIPPGNLAGIIDFNWMKIPKIPSDYTVVMEHTVKNDTTK
jgi:hypothetical protein